MSDIIILKAPANTLATEAKQDDIITALGGITPATGGATEAKQDSLNTLVTTLQTLTETMLELTSRLEALQGTVAPNATLRVTGIAMPSTAVTGPITTAQHIANTAVEKIAIANLTAIQSNLNNVIG